MGSRNTDTGKWGKRWFQELPIKLKCAWIYLCDNCDEIGIWEIHLGKLNFEVGCLDDPITLSDLETNFKVKQLGDEKLLLTGFVSYQYYGDYGGLDPNPKNYFHAKIIRKLQALGLPYEIAPRPTKPPKHTPIDTPTGGVSEGVTNPPRKGKVKKGKVKKEEKGGAGGKTKLDFEAVYELYPEKKGKTDGLDECAKQIKTPEQYAELERAVKAYAAYHKRSLVTLPDGKLEFRPNPQHFSTWMRKGRWRECLDPRFGAPPQLHSGGGAPVDKAGLQIAPAYLPGGLKALEESLAEAKRDPPKEETVRHCLDQILGRSM